MKKVLVFILVLMMVVPFQAFAYLEPTELQEKENKDFNGMFEIAVKSEDEWIHAGNLDYGKFQETKAINLGEYLKGDTAHIKVSQNGGGASYLDVVLLDGAQAVKANDLEGKVLNKLSKEDLDITPVEDGIILEFDACDGKGILSVTGRIEPVVIGKEPLQFPAANNYKSKEEVEDFYNYTLGSNLCTVKVDGILDEVSDKEPFVKEFRVNGSGHPEGELYFWVMNDDENLYVTMDVTPDNTYDGDKDYAKIYVNTDEGIKEFKVSVPETTWGNTGFTYTDKVGYEHKVYEFAIPLSEINAKVGEEIKVAFVIYGTLTLELGYHNPALAYDSENDVYISVFEYVTQDKDNESIKYSNIAAELISNAGKPIEGSLAIIANKNIDNDNDNDNDNTELYLLAPDIAYGGNGEFMVVWSQKGDLICARSISIDDNKINIEKESFAVTLEHEHVSNPKIAYDNIQNLYLIVWNENSEQIKGKFVNKNNTLVDLPFGVSDKADMFITYPSICYSDDESFLVVWKYQDGESKRIQARAVESSTNLSQMKDIAVLVGDDLDKDLGAPNVSINDSNDTFLVSWEENSEIYGKHVNLSALGITVIDNIRISPDDWNDGSYPSSYYDGTNGMLCVWSSAPGDGDYHARLRYVNGTGNVGSPFYTDDYTGDPEDYTEDKRDIIEDYTPIAITGNNRGNNLIAYEIDGSNSIGYRIIGEVESEIIKFNKPDIAYDEDNDLYLSVFEYETYTTDMKLINEHVYGEIVDNDGTMLTRFPIMLTSPGYKCYQPLVEYDKDNDIFLVVWSYQGNDSDKLLMACTVTLDIEDTDEVSYDVGEAYNILGEDIEVDIPFDCDKDLDYGSNGSFLLTFVASSNGEYGIYGKIVNTDYNLDDSIFTISNTIYDEQNPKVCFSPTNNAYLVAWNYWYNTGEKIEAQIIDSGGNLKSTAIISEGSYLTDISLNTDNKQFFIITKEEDTGMKGQYYDLNSEFILEGHGSKIKIVPDDIYANYPVAYNDGKGNMLCTWVDATYGEGSEYYAMLQYVDDENSYIGTAFYPDEYDSDYPKDNLRYDEAIIATSGDNKGKVIIAYIYVPDEENEQYYMLMNDNNEYQNNMRYLVFGEPSEPEPEEPELKFIDVPYEVQVGKTIQAKVEYFDGIEYFDVTNDVLEYKSENLEIATVTSSGAITGVAVGKATISADYMVFINNIPTTLSAITSVNVYKKSTPSPTKILIGQIIVDGKVIKNIYEDDLVSDGGIYSFEATKTGDSARLWLLGSYYKQIANKAPKGTLQLVWDAASYNLPLKSEEVLNEANSIANSKINILLDKVDDKELIDSAIAAVDKLGGKMISGLVDFSVTVEGKTKTANFESYDLYVERTIDQLNTLDKYSTSAMKLIEDDEVFTFAPSVFDDDSATIKYRGNGIFVIVNNPKTFSDITNHWSKMNVEKLAARNIAFGKDDNLFAPNDYITRAEFAVMITRALGITEEEGTINFEDVQGWYAEDISTAYDAGLINGRSDGKFYPTEKILRKDMAVMIHNAIKFADIDVSAKNIEQILSIFTDSSTIAEYAKESTAICADAGIILGRETKEFDPDENATRAEASAIIERMLRFLEFIN